MRFRPHLLTQLILQGESHQAFWRESRDLPLQGKRLVFRLTVPRASIYELLPAIHGWGGASMTCDVITGTLWIACEPKKNNAMKLSDLMSLSQRHSGHAVLFAAPTELKRGIEVWGPAPEPFSLMARIKRQFDPDGLLNPGRFVGGL